MLVVIAVAAILIFSLLAALYYGQAMDYRDAKYKAQYVLVNEILTTIPLAVENITDAVNDMLDNGWRRSAALTASALAHNVQDACTAISAMYSDENDRSSVFSHLAEAFGALSAGAYGAYVELSTGAGPYEEHDLSADTDASLREAIGILEEVGALVSEGVDPDIVWYSDPYDVLDGMYLQELDAAALSLSEAFA